MMIIVAEMEEITAVVVIVVIRITMAEWSSLRLEAV